MLDFIKNCYRKFRNIDDFIMLRVDGGLGSVILMYALGLAIQEKTGKKIKYDVTWFNNNTLDCDNKFTREFTIKQLFPAINFELATDKEIRFYNKFFKYKNNKTWVYNNIVFSNRKPKSFLGYYSHYKYWIDSEILLQKELDFSHWNLDEKNLKMKHEIEATSYSVAMHIRRGDFVNLGWCCLTSEYYIKALQYIKEHVDKPIKLFVFSNDYDYVRKEILPNIDNIESVLVDVNDNDTGYYDLYLMSLCNSIIVANSTFSISSALLNKHKDKIIIAPNTWGYNVGKTNNKGQYDGIEEAIMFPSWVNLNYKTGAIEKDRIIKVKN